MRPDAKRPAAPRARPYLMSLTSDIKTLAGGGQYKTLTENTAVLLAGDEFHWKWFVSLRVSSAESTDVIRPFFPLIFSWFALNSQPLQDVLFLLEQVYQRRLAISRGCTCKFIEVGLAAIAKNI